MGFKMTKGKNGKKEKKGKKICYTVSPLRENSVKTTSGPRSSIQSGLPRVYFKWKFIRLLEEKKIRTTK
jgi:hypothetical protein